MLCLPHSTCSNKWHDHTYYTHKQMVSACQGSTVEILLSFLSTPSTAEWYEAMGAYEVNSFLGALPRTWAPVVNATVNAMFGNGDGTSDSPITWTDYFCETCGTYVNKALQPEHWASICADCNKHEEDCNCCHKCGYTGDDCRCCETCGEAPGWCNCCSYCQQPEGECECDECRTCGYKVHHCGCYSDSHSSFGSTTKVPWVNRADEPIPFDLPTVSEGLHNEVDPLQAAADFYLLDAIKNGVRLNSVVGLTEDAGMRFTQNRDRIVRADSMLSAVTTAARRSHEGLIESVLPAFLAYSVAAVGGELRYHRALGRKDKNTGKAVLPSSRDKAWGKFTSLVQQKGASVLFDADVLFNEFNSSSYGGKLWGNAAKVVGQYLSGAMPAWLFVDRVFTLQHNGGCFLNKVEWRRKNSPKWGLSNMNYVLNAHAGKDVYGSPLENNETDWDLLLALASPGVRSLFDQSERAIRRIARRFGGHLPRITQSKSFEYVQGRKSRYVA